MLALIDPRIWAIGGIVVLVTALGGYATGYSKATRKCEVEKAAIQARVETIETVVTKTVTVADTHTTDRLRRQLSVERATAASLQAQIEELRNANPAPVECRLPDGLRDAINRSLNPEGAE